MDGQALLEGIMQLGHLLQAEEQVKDGHQPLLLLGLCRDLHVDIHLRQGNSQLPSRHLGKPICFLRIHDGMLSRCSTAAMPARSSSRLVGHLTMQYQKPAGKVCAQALQQLDYGRNAAWKGQPWLLNDNLQVYLWPVVRQDACLLSLSAAAGMMTAKGSISLNAIAHIPC